MKRIFLSLLIFLTLPSYATSTQNPWLTEALVLQREIDLNVPLSSATFLGTHNSYNSKSYEIPFVRYVDPNHTLSIYEQLEAGIRAIEMDAHWTITKNFNKDILLCHGQPNHIGCSPFDRPIGEGLQEVKDWLKAHPGELVLLYIERHLDGHEPQLTESLNQFLGEFIYKPQAAKGCQSLPSTITKAEILKTGKQLMIVTKDCADEHAFEDRDKFKLNWHEFAFAGIGTVSEEPFTILDATMNSFTNFPECSKTTIFKNDLAHTSLWRIFEDRTMLANMDDTNRLLFAEDLPDLLRCGINMPTFDMLTVNDLRLVKAIWSWAPGYPTKDARHCALYSLGQGIQNVACLQSNKGYACQNPATKEWKVISTSGQWANGEALCQAQIGADWHFSMPVNGQEMDRLQQAVRVGELQNVWVNYHRNEEKKWVV